MLDKSIDPVDTCGCGDTGYLTTRAVPIDLAHGAGRIENVPIYHCRSTACEEYTLPTVVARRLEEIAEQMEEVESSEVVFTWVNQQEPALYLPSETSLDPLSEAQVQAFTLQFVNREYEDARVVLVVPGHAIFLRSTLEDNEYYLLRYEPESRTEGILFSFHKFYYEKLEFYYDEFLEWSEDGDLKEIGQITMDEVEDALNDEFGELA
ncbi:hypothetical protein JCM17380_54860 [Desulfosporosinus burensis]